MFAAIAEYASPPTVTRRKPAQVSQKNKVGKSHILISIYSLSSEREHCKKIFHLGWDLLSQDLRLVF